MPIDRAGARRGVRVTPVLRGALAGATCATGAVAAHVTAGGEVQPTTAALVVALSVVAGPLLLSRTVDPARTLALALVVQVGWHAAFVLTAPTGGTMAHHVEAGTMALHHLAAAAPAALVALGAERTLVAAVDWLVGVVLPALLRLPAPTPAVRPALALDALARVPDDHVHDPARPLRAPPGRSPLG